MEENFAITETPAGTYIQSTYAGSGKYRPIFIEDGEDPAGTQQVFLSIRPNPTLGSAGTLGIGGGHCDRKPGHQGYTEPEECEITGLFRGYHRLRSFSRLPRDGLNGWLRDRHAGHQHPERHESLIRKCGI